MDYKNSEMKIDQLVGYLKDEKINLVPPFQRGHVWKLPTRRKLIKNILHGKPIPAVFLYKEASGSKYSYNILDGKQRIESLILFVGNEREEMSIPKVGNYFFGDRHKKAVNFKVDLQGKEVSFSQLDESLVRDFREYAIPTIEISLTDQTSLPEIIDLFIDINQQGVKVNRFDIVKAMGSNPLLQSVFDLISEKQKRQQDLFYRQKNNEFTRVLKKLQIIDAMTDANSKVDRMWERLLEVVLFCRTKKHRDPVHILKAFIGGSADRVRISKKENQELRGLFRFLLEAYEDSNLGESKLASDQTHFYTMITSLLADHTELRIGSAELKRKLAVIGRILDGKDLPMVDKKLKVAVKSYNNLAAAQTTHSSRRHERQLKFIDLVNLV